MIRTIQILTMVVVSIMPAMLLAEAPLSDATQECLDCHASIHPGIVEGWQKSRHAVIHPEKAMAAEEIAKKVSSPSIPDPLRTVAVGCAECHTLRPKAHADTVEHNGYDIHVVVSPKDCAVCHSVESEQYDKNIMAHAFKNLAGNPLYQKLLKSIIGKPVFIDGKIKYAPPDDLTKEEACYSCHGTKLEVKKFETRDTDVGELKFAVISGWPNQGVGRVNLDGSLGACSSCHTRHAFSIEMARKPYACKECHVGPDVPAFKVFMASKHGGIFSAMHKTWNFSNVPWTIGKDFKSPTCAVCHISLLVDTDEIVISERTHQMNNRLAWRIFGLIYAHPHPESPDTSIIRNKDNLPLPTDFDGGFSTDFLIDEKEQEQRTQSMQAACRACHDTSWVRGYWKRYENTIIQTNDETWTATQIMNQIWEEGLAEGPNKGANPYDEAIEKKWSDIWLFHSNSARFASAMAGGGDYGVFSNGRYQLSKRIQELKDFLKTNSRKK